MPREYYEPTKMELELGVSSSARQIPLFRQPNTYVCMDLETTGLDPKTCGILEIGAVKVEGGQQTGEFHTMVNTEARMSASARKVNGITRPMLKGAPRTEQAVSEFLEFVGDLPMMGHNAKKFDRLFVEEAALAHLGVVVENEWYDTLELSKKVFGRGFRLSDLCERLGVINENAHRALSDAIATHECYQGMRALIAKVSTDSRDLPEPSAEGPLHGEVVCMSGNPYDPSKRQIMEKTLACGGSLSNGMNKSVTVMLSLDGRESAKVKRAKELAESTGVRVVGASEYYPIIGLDPSLAEPTESYASPQATPHVTPSADNTPKKRNVVMLVVAILFAIGSLGCLTQGNFVSALFGLVLTVVFLLLWNRR